MAKVKGFQPTIPIGKIYAAHAYYSEGHGLRDTAKKFGVSVAGLCKCFQRHELHIRSTSHANRLAHNIGPETKAMYADWLAGMSHRQIAAKYNYSPRNVGYRFKACGYKSQRDELRDYEQTA